MFVNNERGESWKKKFVCSVLVRHFHISYFSLCLFSFFSMFFFVSFFNHFKWQICFDFLFTVIVSTRNRSADYWLYNESMFTFGFSHTKFFVRWICSFYVCLFVFLSWCSKETKWPEKIKSKRIYLETFSKYFRFIWLRLRVEMIEMSIDKCIYFLFIFVLLLFHFSIVFDLEIGSVWEEGKINRQFNFISFYGLR